MNKNAHANGTPILVKGIVHSSSWLALNAIVSYALIPAIPKEDNKQTTLNNTA